MTLPSGDAHCSQHERRVKRLRDFLIAIVSAVANDWRDLVVHLTLANALHTEVDSDPPHPASDPTRRHSADRRHSRLPDGD